MVAGVQRGSGQEPLLDRLEAQRPAHTDVQGIRTHPQDDTHSGSGVPLMIVQRIKLDLHLDGKIKMSLILCL